MNEYAYVGKSSVVGDREFDTVGQRIKLADEDLVGVLRGGALFIPIDMFNHEFDGFSPEDFARYSNPYFFGEPSEDYVRRLEACRDHAREMLRAMAPSAA